MRCSNNFLCFRRTKAECTPKVLNFAEKFWAHEDIEICMFADIANQNENCRADSKNKIKFKKFSLSAVDDTYFSSLDFGTKENWRYH